MTPSVPVPRSEALVVGLGSPDRGDDAVGGHVARAVAALRDPRLEVLVHEDPTDLVQLWDGRDRVVVVDATRGGGAPGTIQVLDTGAGLAPLPEAAWARTGRGGTHAFGLATAVELARVLDRLPARVTVVGIEAHGFEHGAPLTTAVAAAVPHAVDAVLAAAHRDAAAVHASATEPGRAPEVSPEAGGDTSGASAGRGRADVPR